jgi:Acyltransferase family
LISSQFFGEHETDKTPFSIPRGSDKMTAAGSKPDRIPALDFTKGALVLIMVLYHWINYFCGPQDQRYLRFLTPSFIFISGFIISNVYIAKYGILDLQLPKRLIQRGLKILGVFVLLNVTRNCLVLGQSQEQALPAHLSIRSLVDIYLIGSGIGGGQVKAVAFFILVPISYLLILSALLLAVSRFYRYTFHVVCLFFLLCIVVLNSKGFEIPNLELLAIGLLGVIAGYLPIEKVNTLVRHPFLLAAAYLVYLGAISFWNVVYPLQIIGVYLSLMILYLLGQQSGEPGKVRETIVLLGKYSLFGYIAQIAILQSLRLGFNHIGSEAVVLGLSFVLAFALTIISVEVVDLTRAKSTIMDRLYKTVFA